MKPVFRHYGAKALIAEWVVALMPAHKIYVEPFCGSACVALAKPPSLIEIINDLDGQIVNAFQVLRSNPFELAALLWATPYAQASTALPLQGDELQRAAAFIARSAQVYCGDANSSSFALDKTAAPHKPKPHVWRDWAPRILPAAARLKNTQITNRDGVQLIREFSNNADALIYVDPPYLGHETEFRERVECYDALVAASTGARARIMISEFPTAGEKWKGWRTESRQVPGRARTGQSGKVRKSKLNTEVVYMNFDEAGKVFT